MKATQRPQYLLTKTNKSTFSFPTLKTNKSIWEVEFYYWISHEYGEADLAHEVFYFENKDLALAFERKLSVLAASKKIHGLKMRQVDCLASVTIQDTCPELNPNWDSDLARFQQLQVSNSF